MYFLKTALLLTAAALSASLLGACGFHLLGTEAINLPQQIALIGNTDNDIATALKAQKQSNISITTPDTADLTLELGEITTNKDVLSKTASGTVSEYRVSMSVVIQVYGKNKKQLLVPTRLSTARNLMVGSGYATAEDAELERLNTDMAQELANSIVYRVRAAWLSQQPKANKATKKQP